MSKTRLSNLFRQEVLERFAQSQLPAVFLARPLPGYIVAIGATTTCIALAVFATSLQFARKEPALGMLVPASGWSRVSAPMSGVARRVAAAGDRVSEGDVLLALSSADGVRATMTLPDELLGNLAEQIGTIEERLTLMDKRHGNLRAALRDDVLANMRAMQRVDAELRLHRRRHALATTQYEGVQQLARSGMVARKELLNAAEELQARLLAIAGHERLREELRAKIRAAGTEGERLTLDHQVSQSRLREELHQLIAEQSRVQAQQTGLVLAPKDGLVASVRVRDGDWVETGKPLLDIVPLDSDLHARLYVAPLAMAFVDVGTEVRVFVDAFPYEHYGAQVGTVVSISETTVQPAGAMGIAPAHATYQVDVAFPNGFSSMVRSEALRPGMTVGADLVRDYSSLAGWLLEPIRGTAARL